MEKRMNNRDSHTIDLLNEIAEFLEDQEDVVDGSYGVPHPNKAMSLRTQVDGEIERLKRSSGPAERDAVLEEAAAHLLKCARATGDRLWESAAEQVRALKNAAPQVPATGTHDALSSSTTTKPSPARASSEAGADTGLHKANAAIGARVRMLVNGGSFDLRDSPKSFIGTCERLVREADEAFPPAPYATPEPGRD